MSLGYVVAGLVFLVTNAPVPLAAAPAGTAFTYQGQLKLDGVPVNASTDFVFRLFDAESGGSQVGSDAVRNDVPVVNGLFTVNLDFGASAFNGEARWLAAVVEGTPLATRQLVAPAPYALKVPGIDGHSLDAVDGNPSDAVFVNAAGRVGIGTTTPTATLSVEGGLDVFDTAHQGIGLTSHLLLFTRVSDNEFIYKYDEADGMHTFYGDGLPRVSILDNGRVGVGTTTPSREMEVAGPADVEIGIRSTDADGRLWTLQSSRVSGTALDGTFQIIDRTANASRLTITPAANVGIGTTVPANRLHIFNGTAGVAPFGNAELALEDNGSCYLSLVAPDANDSGILFGNPGSGAAAGGILFNAGAANGLSFRTGTNDTNMVLTSSGRLGLGTAAPAAAMDVRGGTLATPVLNVAGSNQAAVQIAAGNGHPTGASLTSGIPGSIDLTAGNGGLGQVCLPTCATTPSGGGSVTIRGGDAASVPFTQGAPGGDILLLPGVGGDGAPDGVPGSVGIATENPSSTFRLDVNGTVRCTTLTEISSRSLKRNIRPLPDALPRLLRLQGVAFEWDKAHGGRSDLGFIAEDAAEVFPELVLREGDEQTAAGLNYSHLTAVLVEALKEQQAQIDGLIAQGDSRLRARDEEIRSLKERLARVEVMLEKTMRTSEKGHKTQ